MSWRPAHCVFLPKFKSFVDPSSISLFIICWRWVAIINCVVRFCMFNDFGVNFIEFIAPWASRPNWTYCCCRVFTRLSTSFSIVSNSRPNIFPNVLVDAAPYLKYSLSDSLCLSRFVANCSEAVLILVIDAVHWPVAFTLCKSDCAYFACAAAAVFVPTIKERLRAVSSFSSKRSCAIACEVSIFIKILLFVSPAINR